MRKNIDTEKYTTRKNRWDIIQQVKTEENIDILYIDKDIIQQGKTYKKTDISNKHREIMQQGRTRHFIDLTFYRHDIS